MAAGPKFIRFFWPVVAASRELGGSARPREVVDLVLEKAGISDDERAERTKRGSPRLDNQLRSLSPAGFENPCKRLLTATSSPGPSLDARAKREYRQRINELQADIDEAEQWDDPERADASRRELDALIGQLRRAVGLSGRDRPQGSGAERARINAARNIRRAITAIHKVAPQLAAHLTVSIRT